MSACGETGHCVRGRGGVPTVTGRTFGATAVSAPGRREGVRRLAQASRPRSTRETGWPESGERRTSDGGHRAQRRLANREHPAPVESLWFMIDIENHFQLEVNPKASPRHHVTKYLITG